MKRGARRVLPLSGLTARGRVKVNKTYAHLRCVKQLKLCIIVTRVNTDTHQHKHPPLSLFLFNVHLLYAYVSDL